MKTVRVSNGQVEEFENGTIRRTFGSNIVFAATDGSSVVAVTRAGRVELYVNGSQIVICTCRKQPTLCVRSERIVDNRNNA